MRILLVSHLFPPAHSAGVEVFASELALALAAQGHQVFVLHTRKRVGRRDLVLHRRRYRGLPVFEIVNNLFHLDFESTWNHARIDELFEEALQEVQPDVVHFHHLMYLSVGCLALAREHARAVLFTPHDFYLECGAMGQLVYSDGSVCHQVDTQRCGECLPRTAWSQSSVQRRVGKALGLLHSVTRLDLGPVARRLASPSGARRALDAQPASLPSVPPEVIEQFAAAAQKRRAGLLHAVQTQVHRVLCPSQFLMDRMRRFGLAHERTFLCPTGVDEGFLESTRSDAAVELPPGDPEARAVQITFLGTMIPIKGPQVLLEAWGRLPAPLRQRGELSLCGPLHHAPAFVERLQERASELYVEISDRLTREQVARKLRQTDLLVMPSLWFENRPLILHEALALGVPCLVTGEGGMAELVRPDIDGWHFPMGDVDALAQRLHDVLSDPSPLAALQPRSPELLTWREAADVFLDHYSEVLQSGGTP